MTLIYSRLIMVSLAGSCIVGIKPDDIVYCPLPLYHSSGGMLGAGGPLCCGSSTAFRKKFSASAYWTDCIKYNCTVNKRFKKLNKVYSYFRDVKTFRRWRTLNRPFFWRSQFLQNYLFIYFLLNKTEFEKGGSSCRPYLFQFGTKLKLEIPVRSKFLSYHNPHLLVLTSEILYSSFFLHSYDSS